VVRVVVEVVVVVVVMNDFGANIPTTTTIPQLPTDPPPKAQVVSSNIWYIYICTYIYINIIIVIK
jgi:hypothetical protein